MLFLRGQWDEAHRALTTSVELARSFDGTLGEVLGEQRLGAIEAARGEFAAARERLERALARARASKEPMVRAHGLGRVIATLASTEFLAGDLEAATRHLARGMATHQVVGDCAGCDVHLYPAAVPIYLALGDLVLAEESARKADETAGAFRSQAWVATARYLLGLVAAQRDDRELAEQRLEEAIDRFDGLRQPYDAALASLALARLSDDAARASSLRARAHEQLAALGVAVPAAD